MRYVYALAFVLLLGVGCSETDQAQWNDAMKDWRGDNMQMRYGNSGTGQTKSAN
jgi:hypothetical protein